MKSNAIPIANSTMNNKRTNRDCVKIILRRRTTYTRVSPIIFIFLSTQNRPVLSFAPSHICPVPCARCVCRTQHRPCTKASCTNHKTKHRFFSPPIFYPRTIFVDRRMVLYEPRISFLALLTRQNPSSFSIILSSNGDTETLRIDLSSFEPK